MSDIAIHVEHLGKQYRIGQKAPYMTFRDAITNAATAPFKRITRGTKSSDDQRKFWALKDISFDVEKGDVVGIIGRNGAGKSTLLKILSRITDPTEGYANIYGRVGSLLEVGTGFHPELTGRENVYLSGAIIGMKKAEIDGRFDNIVKFADIEKFLDTPIKHYSSGMQVRLGFAVAAHLETEILIVDEVLAVGDVNFQKKCIGKMGTIAKDGKTILFVSHNMAAVEKLCNRGILLNGGKVIYYGSQIDTITQYLKSLSGKTASLIERKDRIGSGEIKVIDIEIKDINGNILDNIKSGQDIDIYLHYETKTSYPRNKVLAGLHIKTYSDIPVFLQHNRLTKDEFNNLPNKGAFVCRINKLPLPQSSYRLGFSIMEDYGLNNEYLDSIGNAIEINVIEGDYFGSGEIPPLTHGCCLVPAKWRIE